MVELFFCKEAVLVRFRLFPNSKKTLILDYKVRLSALFQLIEA